MSKTYNFSAGPAVLPRAVLERAQAEFLDYQGLGYSIVEMSHRSAPYEELYAKITQDFKSVLKIPDHYHVLLLPGGARIQFAMILLNLLNGKTKADYCDSGFWSQSAINVAKSYCDVNIIASGADKNYYSIPEPSEWQYSDNSAFIHYTSNETIHGLSISEIPAHRDIPVVCDMTSDILSKPLPIDKFGLIYAAAQKNIAPAGVSLVIVREDLMGNAHPSTPLVFNYAHQLISQCRASTPPVFSIYMAGLMLEWIKEQGGLGELDERNQIKANTLYHHIDKSGLFVNDIQSNLRSYMNISFRCVDENLHDMFVSEAQKAGLVNLQGHRLLGGLRASLYNAMPLEGVNALISFMNDFEKQYG